MPRAYFRRSSGWHRPWSVPMPAGSRGPAVPPGASSPVDTFPAPIVRRGVADAWACRERVPRLLDPCAPYEPGRAHGAAARAVGSSSPPSGLRRGTTGAPLSAPGIVAPLHGGPRARCHARRRTDRARAAAVRRRFPPACRRARRAGRGAGAGRRAFAPHRGCGRSGPASRRNRRWPPAPVAGGSPAAPRSRGDPSSGRTGAGRRFYRGA